MTEHLIAYVHDNRCAWVDDFAACNCGLDDAYADAVRTEAVRLAETLTRRHEKAVALADEWLTDGYTSEAPGYIRDIRRALTDG